MDALFVDVITPAGTIRLELFPTLAPRLVRNFIDLAEGNVTFTDVDGVPHREPYYDKTTFYKVVPGFAIYGGDRSGTGEGGPGYLVDDEYSPELVFNRPYLLAMVNSGKNRDGTGTNGSRFMITLSPAMHQNFKNPIFGEVADDQSRRVVDSIGRLPNPSLERPQDQIEVTRVVVQRVSAS